MKRFISGLLAISIAVSSLAQAAPTLNFSYDAAGRPSGTTSALGANTTTSYDNLGRVSGQTLPLGAVSYGYNGQDALTSAQDPRSLSTTYAVDSFGQTQTQVSPDTGTTGLAFDKAGNLVSRQLADGSVVTFTYDAGNRLTGISNPAFNATFGYDAAGKAGHLTSSVFPAGTAAWTYDAQGRVASATQTVDGKALTVGYQWQGDRLKQLTYPSGKVVSYTLDHGRVTGLTVNGVVAISGVTYQSFGAVSGWTMGGAGAYARQYDSYGRINGYTGSNGLRTLTWDDDNRITKVQEGSTTVAEYGYDSLSRLTSATEAGVVRGYAYDLTGNRTEQTVAGTSFPVTVSSTSNQLVSAALPSGGTAVYGHNANGDVTTDGISSSLTWNALGFATSSTAGGVTTDYAYNGFGQRVKKSNVGATRYFVYAEDQTTLLGEYDAAGQAITEYVYVEGLPALVLKAAGTYYVLPDQLGTPRAVKTSTGVLAWAWQSDAFGNGAAADNPAGLGVFDFGLRFPGQVFDVETGLHYNNARYYDPVIGRYRSSDPIGLFGGFSTYSYSHNGPVIAVDPTGEMSPQLIAAGVGFVAGASFKAIAEYENFSGALRSRDWTTAGGIAAKIGLAGVSGAVAGATGAWLAGASSQVGFAMMTNGLANSAIGFISGGVENRMNGLCFTEGAWKSANINFMLGSAGGLFGQVLTNVAPRTQLSVNRSRALGLALSHTYTPPTTTLASRIDGAGLAIGNATSNFAPLIPTGVSNER